MYELITNNILSAFISVLYSLKLSVNEIEFLFTNFVLIKQWNNVERSCFFSRSLKDLKRHLCGIELWLFRTVWTNYEKTTFTGVFLKFCPDSLNRERSWAFTFLGSLNPWDHITDYPFKSFFGVNKPIQRSGQWSILPFLSSFIKMKEHKKSGGFMHNIFYAIVHWVIFKLGTCFMSMSNGWVIHCLRVMPFLLVFILHQLVILSVIHGVWCLFRRVNGAKSYYLTCRQFEDCMPWLYQLYHPLYPFPCVSPTLITKSSTLVSCRLMKDTSMPSFDDFHPIDFNTLFRIEI